jgi:hypothetical protein
MVNFLLSSTMLRRYILSMKTWLSGGSVRRVCKFLPALILITASVVLGQETNTPSPEAAAEPAPPARKFISPFSGVAAPSYSYTNPYNLTNVPPSSIVRSTLLHDPFSGTTMNPDAAPVPSQELPTWEPPSPPVFNYPPGTILRPASAIAPALQSTNAAVVIVPDLSVVPDLTYFNLPPGATIRRSASPDLKSN